MLGIMGDMYIYIQTWFIGQGRIGQNRIWSVKNQAISDRDRSKSIGTSEVLTDLTDRQLIWPIDHNR
jgi:hypothetical protein